MIGYPFTIAEGLLYFPATQSLNDLVSIAFSSVSTISLVAFSLSLVSLSLILFSKSFEILVSFNFSDNSSEVVYAVML